MVPVKSTSRQRVLAYLRRQPGASAGQIGSGLKMTAPAVRHHLGILESDGRIVAVGQERLGGRGRPVRRYRLSDRVLGENLAMLSDSLLHSCAGRPRRGALLPVLAAGLLRQLGAGPAAGPAASRLARLVDDLNAAHYAARWEAGAEGPRIVFGHCPYAAIIEDHPELCQMDALALGQRMQADATQTAKIDPHGQGPDHCMFRLRPPAPAPGERGGAHPGTEMEAGPGIGMRPGRLMK